MWGFQPRRKIIVVVVLVVLLKVLFRADRRRGSGRSCGGGPWSGTRSRSFLRIGSRVWILPFPDLSETSRFRLDRSKLVILVFPNDLSLWNLGHVLRFIEVICGAPKAKLVQDEWHEGSILKMTWYHMSHLDVLDVGNSIHWMKTSDGSKTSRRSSMEVSKNPICSREC